MTCHRTTKHYCVLRKDSEAATNENKGKKKEPLFANLKKVLLVLLNNLPAKLALVQRADQSVGLLMIISKKQPQKKRLTFSPTAL